MPRDAQGHWIDASGAQIGHTDPNDPRFKDQPDYSFKNGKWYYKDNADPIPNGDDLPTHNPDGSFSFPDGTSPTEADKTEINNQGNGAPPSPGAKNYGATGFADPSGITDNLVKPDAPGASLDTTQPDDERARLGGLLAQLQEQAKTGGGAWESALANATGQATAAASALGQSTPGVDNVNELRNIGNARAAVDQRAVGQGNILRAQTQQDAARQVGDVSAQMGALDAAQAGSKAGALQQVRETNNSITEQANKVNGNIYGGAAQAFSTLAALSDGGKVPGKPKVFGDSEVNDTVPALLSPGEIVIPRSIAQSPDADRRAADFVAAVQSRGGQPGKHNFDDGGTIPDSSVNATGLSSSGPFSIPIQQQAASVKNGGLLDTADYDKSREAANANAANFLAQFAGKGPSVAPQQAQNSTDESLADALRARDNSRGMGASAGAGDSVMSGSIAAQKGAGRAAATSAEESTKGAQEFAQAIARQRAQDLALANAKQQAAWRNTMMNSGIGIAQQATLRNLLGGAGQAAATLTGLLPSDLGKGSDVSFGDASFGDAGNDKSAIDDAFNADPSPMGDYSPAPIDEGGTASDGGWVRGLVRKMASGGLMAPGPGPFESQADWEARQKPAPAVATAAAPPRPMPERWVEPAPGQLPGLGGPVPATGPGLLARPPEEPAPVATKPAKAPAAAMTGKPKAAPAEAEPKWAKEENEANRLMYEAEKEKARQVADVHAEYGKRLEQHAIQDAEMRTRAAQESDAALNEIRKAREDIKKVDTSVDPGRFWASRSTPGKIAGVIGLALGAIGAGNDGVNRAAGLIQQAVDRDLDAQKAEHEFRLKKGQSALESATSLYGLHRQRAADDIAASAAAKGTALELAKNQIDLAEARASDPAAKAKLQMLSAQVAKSVQDQDATVKQRGFDNSIKAGQLRNDTIRANAEAAKVVAPNQKANELVTAVETEHQTIQEQGAKLKALIQKYGTGEVTGPAEAEMRQAVDNMATAAAKLKDPSSVARQSEVEGEAKNIFKPGFFQSADTALKQIDSYMSNAKARRSDAYRLRGLQEPGETGTKPAASDQSAAARAWLAANPNDPRAAAVRARLGTP